MRPHRAVIFDLDQTLLNREASLIAFLTWQICSFKLVPHSQKDQFIIRFLQIDQNGHIWKDIVYQSLINEFKITNCNMQQLLQSYLDDFHHSCIAFEHVNEAIKELHLQGFKIGLISNGKSPFQEKNFEALNLSHYFSSILVSEAVGWRKPDPQIFLLSCPQLDCLPQHCIFVGDHPIADIQGAKAFGMKTIFFHRLNTCDAADANLHDYAELPRLITETFTSSSI